MARKAMIGGESVFGIDIDANSRCRHWHSVLDIVALKFACCGKWFSCFDCHQELADHEPGVWPRSKMDESAVMCGGCGLHITVSEYISGDPACPSCSRGFNPRCAKHYHLYFER